MTSPILLADVGGTKTRVALMQSNGKLEVVRSVENDTVDGLESVLGEVLAGTGRRRPRAAVIAVAGWVQGDEVAMTNRGWRFSRRALAKALKLSRLLVINDFAALAHALPALGAPDLLVVGKGRNGKQERLLACGPGTGFGTAVLVCGRKPRALPSEAGHMRLGAATADEARVLAHLVRDRGPVVVEDVLSGRGLERLHNILSGQQQSAEAIIIAARAGQSAARTTADVFLRLFGRIAGDLALAFSADAVFLAGGISRALGPLVPASPFRAAFEEHPPYQDRLAAIPIHVVVHANPGLLGAAQLGRELRS